MTKATLSELDHDPHTFARTCGVEEDFLAEYASSKDQSAYYHVVRIPKRGKRRNGQFRIVFAAREHRLAQLHRSISMIVMNSASFGGHVQGFIKKRSAFTNASRHLGARALLHADIKDFFDSIRTSDVRAALVTNGATAKVADLLARLSTIDGFLRQGTRCSPAIANLVCADLDNALMTLARTTRCVYSRYADDITFSGSEVPEDAAIVTILNAHGFSLREGRCIRQFRGRSQFVTGLNICDSTGPRLPRRLKRRLRLTMHYIQKFGLDGHLGHKGADVAIQEEAWLSGMLRYARSIEPKLIDPWQRILTQAQTLRQETNSDVGY